MKGSGGIEDWALDIDLCYEFFQVESFLKGVSLFQVVLCLLLIEVLYTVISYPFVSALSSSAGRVG